MTSLQAYRPAQLQIIHELTFIYQALPILAKWLRVYELIFYCGPRFGSSHSSSSRRQSQLYSFYVQALNFIGPFSLNHYPFQLYLRFGQWTWYQLTFSFLARDLNFKMAYHLISVGRSDPFEKWNVRWNVSIDFWSLSKHCLCERWFALVEVRKNLVNDLFQWKQTLNG